MEGLAYLHLALANEAPEDTASTLTWKGLKLSKGSTVYYLSLIAITLGVFGMANQASAAIKQGARGFEVKSLQQRLQKLGYFKADVTGYYGGVTKEAVREFQKDRGLQPDGIVGKDTQSSLEEHQQEVSESAQGVWRLGDRDAKVSEIQQRLEDAGFAIAARKDAVFDGATQEAVRQFQQAKGLKVDGIVGPRTLAALPTAKTNEDLSETKTKQEEPTTKQKEPNPWYYDESAPLEPFIRKSN
ncbi:MAG TPA: peptidoglycan-binding protein [Chroococcales cyanobacterium]|jgi:peptidoglycan hydrolase-like protein with peptidoglycan-binding domain